LSRTARTASITVVDNIVRALPLLIERVKSIGSNPHSILEDLMKKYDNNFILRESEAVLRGDR
jgi:4-phosphopantoate---beta-alanine ligase